MFYVSDRIKGFDDELWNAIQGECQRQEEHVELIASENYTSPRVLEAQVRRAWLRLGRLLLRHDALGDACSGASLHSLPWRRRHG